MRRNDLLQAKKCPNCGYVYDTYLLGGVNEQDKRVRFGTIYVTCPRCKQTFRDNDIFELAIMDPPKEYVMKFSEYTAGAILFVMMGVFFCAMYIHKGDSTGAVIIGLFMVGLAIYYLFRECDRNEEHSRTIQDERWRSIERIKRDPEYARMLKADGFRLPDGVEVADQPIEPSTEESEGTSYVTKGSSDEREIKADSYVQQADTRGKEFTFDKISYYSQDKVSLENETNELDVAKEKRRLLNYCFPAKEELLKTNIFILFFSVFVFVCFLIQGNGNSERTVIAAGAATGFLVLFLESIIILPSLIAFKRARKCIREIEESGELEHVLNDFCNAREVLEDRCRIGKDFLYVRLSKTEIVDYNDIESVEASYSSGKRRYRLLYAHLKSRGALCLCNNLNNVYDTDVQEFVRYLSEKNPSIEIGV